MELIDFLCWNWPARIKQPSSAGSPRRGFSVTSDLQRSYKSSGSIKPSDKDITLKKKKTLRRLSLNHRTIPSSAQSRSRPLALIMRLVFYCESTNRKTYGVNLDAPHHIHPGVISTKATEAVATFGQPKGPGPMISARQFAPDITRRARGASH